VNLAYGHEAGDLALRAVSERLAAVVRPGDTLARYGLGDEFVMICEDLDEPAFASDIAKRVLAVMDQPFPIGSECVPLTASVGIAVGLGGDGPEAVLRAADMAMFEAKAGGGGCIRVASGVCGRSE